MKLAMTKIAAGLVLAGFAVAANAASITSMNITSGTFAMDDPTATTAFSFINANTNLVSGYLGDSLATVSATAANPEDIVSFSFYAKPVHVYTAAQNYGDTNTPGAGSVAGGGPVPTGNITGGTMTLDLTSWFANWNNSDFNVGNIATGSVVALGGGNYSYDVSWNATIVGGAFDGATAYWTLQGTAAAVPEASTYGMMLAGLGLVGGMVARRRKLMA